MKNQYSGINLLGLFSDLPYEERKDRQAELHQNLFDDGKISKPETYTYRGNERTKGQLGREEIEYALKKGYIQYDELLTPPEIIDKVLDKILTEFQKEVKLKANDLILWELYDKENFKKNFY